MAFTCTAMLPKNTTAVAILFQSTRPRRARPTVPLAKFCTGLFQSTRPRGARLSRASTRSSYFLFQSTRPRGARRNMFLITLLRVVCFNPRAHVGRDASLWACWPTRQVSIHAPTWGATINAKGIYRPMIEFQSTRPRGARLFCFGWSRASRCFNPRAHVGRDPARRRARN